MADTLNDLLARRPADTEASWAQWAATDLALFWLQVQHYSLHTHDDLTLWYGCYEHPEPRPWVIISPGRVEHYRKYQEVMLEFAAQGYNVAALDHRGQGYSDRLTGRHEQGHVQDFNDYVQDLAALVEQLKPQMAGQPAVLLGHSMGATIASLYLARYAHPFKAAAFSAPMMGINTHPWPAAPARLMVRVGARLNQRVQPARPWYFPGMKDYEALAFGDNELTHSEQRYEFFTQMYLADPQLRVGGPTWQWINQGLAGAEMAITEAGDIQIPVLVLQAGDDNIVANPGQQLLVDQLSHPDSELQVVPGAHHEILQETDILRRPALSQVKKLFYDVLAIHAMADTYLQNGPVTDADLQQTMQKEPGDDASA